MEFQLEQTLRGKSDDELLQELRSAAAKAGGKRSRLQSMKSLGLGMHPHFNADSVHGRKH